MNLAIKDCHVLYKICMIAHQFYTAVSHKQLTGKTPVL